MSRPPPPETPDERKAGLRPMTAAEIAAVVAELAPALAGARVRDVRRRGETDLLLTLRAPGRNFHLLLSAHRSASRILLLRRKPPGPWRSGAFRDACRHDLRAARIVSIEAVPDDRRVTLTAVRLDSEDDAAKPSPVTVRLEAELYGRAANLILVDEEGGIRELLRPVGGKRQLAAGSTYRPLPPPVDAPAATPAGDAPSAPVSAPTPAPVGDIPPAPSVAGAEVDDEFRASRTAEDRYETAVAELDAAAARAGLMKRLDAALNRSRRKCRSFAEQLEATGRADAVRREGELLKSEVHRIKRGDAAVTLTDYYQDPPAEVTVQLDPVRTPQENLAAIFKRYRKLRDGVEVTRRLLAEAEDRVARLEELRADLDCTVDAAAIEAMEQEMTADGFLPRRQGAPRRRSIAGAPETERAPLTFTSADGLSILVGRSGADNDRITFTVARGGDLWLHVRDYPGSHVVVRLPRGKPCPAETLLDAAHLAVHFSKIRGATTATVTHTPRKHVSRIRNAPPGKVALSRASALDLRIEPERLERLFGEHPPPRK